jgi:Domain of unknown function (DUF4157)
MEARTSLLDKPASGRKPGAATNAFPVVALQRKCACGGTPASASGECEQCKKKKLQRRAADAEDLRGVPPIVDEVLNSPGHPLDAATRTFMEPRFGYDFSKVRVHSDHKAAESARSVHALAYTVGSNVVFAGGQYAPTKTSGRKLLAHELTHVVQQRFMRNAAPQARLEVGPVNDSLEQEADRFAEKVAGVSATASVRPAKLSGGHPARLQRAVAGQAASDTSTAPPAASPIVDDEAQQLGPGQMRKTEFLDKLRGHVCSVADSVLVSVGRTAQGCPMIERWIGHLRQKNIQYIERGIRKYASLGAGAGAQDYITAVGERVREGVTRWASTGDISGVPPELMSEMAGGGILGALGSAVAGIGNAISGIGHLFAKGKDGGAREGNAAAIQTQLNSGTSARPLESGVQARMETAFGHSFSRVRVHADSRAAQLSSRLNARAFTVGSDVAFAAGEYNPGTLVGDALIAHELAHVVQQQGGAAAPMAKGESEYSRLEEDADLSAMGAIISMWRDSKLRVKGIATNAMPRLRSGLKLQRCGGSKPQIKPETTNIQFDANANCAGLENDISSLLGKALPTVRGALSTLDSPKNVADQLMKNFKMSAEDPRVGKVRQVLQGAIESMEATAQIKTGKQKWNTVSEGTTPTFRCLPCSGYGGTSYACDTSQPVPLIISLCVAHGKFASPHPLQTMIHEFIHANCGRTKDVVSDPKYLNEGTGVTIQGGEIENKQYQMPQEKIDENLKSAYSYAQFVIDVTGQDPNGT